jgi:hypothetical protein
MLKADKAEVSWDADKKSWLVRIQIGEEVIRRMCKNAAQDLDDGALQALAVQTAADEGYQIGNESVTVKH